MSFDCLDCVSLSKKTNPTSLDQLSRTSIHDSIRTGAIFSVSFHHEASLDQTRKPFDKKVVDMVNQNFRHPAF